MHHHGCPLFQRPDIFQLHHNRVPHLPPLSLDAFRFPENRNDAHRSVRQYARNLEAGEEIHPAASRKDAQRQDSALKNIPA